MPEPALTPMPPVPGLGEPRKVRTVSIRPDGSPAQAAAADANGNRPIATGSAPSRSIAGSPASANLPIAAAVPPPAAPKPQERATTPPAATTPAAPTRLASAAPAAPTPAPANAAIRAGTGDFVVQLGAPGSEQEARATFAALQRKYPQQLGGQSPIVRKTELAGGKTVYRLRVGPYSRDDATSMCSALQAAGGQCFIAKN
jgi:cell division protein FtsN